ncbi:HNH endonuclease [Williamsia serinedens]|uniref:HNH endonuclease n=2 Tax=Williamsia serinedens TaxID=391736 RepID=A0ABT1H7L8_9NOCA|nr:HNH endonuclease [Williamsia serinedens]
MTKSVADYLSARFEKRKDGCWMWVGSVNAQGYGRAYVDGRSARAHRVSFATWKGALGSDEEIRHSCGVRLCVNPDHLTKVDREVTDRKTYLLERVSVTDQGCWEWTEYVNKAGYGRCFLKGQTWFAHRLSYAIHKGDPGLGFVCHTCDNPKCCNPDHLYLGDNDTNMADKARRERHPFMRFTRVDVARIRSRRASGELLRTIAEDYDTDESVICAIAKRRRRTA